MLAAHRVFGGRAGVTGSRAEDVDRLATLVEHVLEEIAQKLHRHILEGERRAVGELLRVQAVFEPGQRGDFSGIAAIARKAIDLGGVGLGDDGLEISRRNVGDEFGEDFVGQIGIRQLAPGVELGAGDLRIGFRQVETAVRGQATEKNVAESLGRGLAASRDVAHGVKTWKAKNGNFTASTATGAWLVADCRQTTQLHRSPALLPSCRIRQAVQWLR